MKLKKKARNTLLVILIIAIGVGGYFIYKYTTPTKTVKETKVVGKIEKYGYELKDTKSKKYKTMFKELKKILESDEVDEEKYVRKISEMFIYDFYTLSNKSAKTDIGGVDFVYPSILENFLENAQDTYYKYIENNIFNERKQKLPEVDEVTIDSVEKTAFTYGNNTDNEAYKVDLNWTYTDEDFSSYQKKATLIFIHDDIKLELVELQ